MLFFASLSSSFASKDRRHCPLIDSRV
jgi:hypothetical protein